MKRGWKEQDPLGLTYSPRGSQNSILLGILCACAETERATTEWLLIGQKFSRDMKDNPPEGSPHRPTKELRACSKAIL